MMLKTMTGARTRRKLTGYWNYQEALHAVSLGAAVHPLKYRSWVRKLVDAQFVQGSGWEVSHPHLILTSPSPSPHPHLIPTSIPPTPHPILT